jgi:hypothetical protein
MDDPRNCGNWEFKSEVADDPGEGSNAQQQVNNSLS